MTKQKTAYISIPPFLCSNSTVRSRKLHGTAPSLGAVLYYISDELAVESVKILTGYGTPKYIDKVLFRDIISGEEHTLGKEVKTEKQTTVSNSNGKEIMLSSIIIILMTIYGVSFWPMLIIAPVAVLILPFVLFKQKTYIMKMTFITTTVYALTMFAVCIFCGLFSVLTRGVIQSIVLTLIAFGLISILVLCFCTLNYGICKIKKLLDREG